MASVPASTTKPHDPTTIDVQSLSFTYFGTPILTDVTFQLPAGARCILAGANGAGKTTLLRLLAGKHIPTFKKLKILDMLFVQDQENGLAFLGNEWRRSVPFAGGSVPYTCDIPVSEMMLSVQNAYPKRRDHLMQLLDINPEWRMHQVSDGQRRRVQIMLGLIKPFRVLFMDEITVDLDVVARHDLLNYLTQECKERNCTIIYATHIFDGLDDWATHIMRVTDGKVTNGAVPLKTDPEYQHFAQAKNPAPLLRAVEKWLRRERSEKRKRGEREEAAPLDRAMAGLNSDKNKSEIGPQGGYESGRVLLQEYRLKKQKMRDERQQAIDKAIAMEEEHDMKKKVDGEN
eukprot:g692.t1